MFLAVYRFEGEPAALQASHARVLSMLPPDRIPLNIAVTRPRGLDVYDVCASRAEFETFSTSAGFQGVLAQAGLPRPNIEPLGEISALVLQGRMACPEAR